MFDPSECNACVQDIELVMLPSHGRCEISTLMEGIDPELQALGSMDMDRTGVVVDKAPITRRLSIIRETIAAEEREKLHPAMQQLCTRLPIYTVEKVVITEQEYQTKSYLNTFATRNITTSNMHRVKRSPFYDCNARVSF